MFNHRLRTLIYLILVLLISTTSSCHDSIKDESWITGDDEEQHNLEENNNLIYENQIPVINKNKLKINNKLTYHKPITNKNNRNLLVILPLSGRLKSIGKRIKSAIIKTNQELEEPFKLIFFDTQSDEYNQKGRLYDFVIKNDIKFIIGGLQKEDTKDIAEVAGIKNILVFSLSPDSILALTHKNLYIQSITPENITYSIVKYATEEKGFRKFAILYPYTEIGLEYYKYFKYYVNNMGGEITKEVIFNPKAKNLDKPISKLVDRDKPYKRADFQKYIRRARKIVNKYRKHHYLETSKLKLKPIFDYDAIFIPVSDKKVNYIIPILAAWDLPLQTNNKRLMEQVYHKYLNKNQKYVQVFGTPFWYNQELFKANSPYINGSIFPSPYNTDLDNNSIPFVNLFKNRIIKNKSLIYEALVYDMVNIIYYVFEKKEDINTYEGIMGRYSLYKNQLFKDFTMAIIHNDRFLSY